MIQLRTGGPRIVKDDGWAAQQREFAHRHCVVFKGFVDDGILGRVPRMLEAGQFYTREDTDKKGEVFARELTMRAGPLLPMFLLLLNQPRLFEAIAEFTGSEEAIQRFNGRCFKLLPGGGHFDSWHTDAVRERLYGLTINLSSKPFSGGGFQVRSGRTKEVFQTVAASRFGDACLFRIHKSLEHRALPVEGTAPRCVYGGWFLAGGADYRETLRQRWRPLEDQTGSPPELPPQPSG